MTDAAAHAAAPKAAASAPVTYDLTGARVFVAGHRGMVGSALCRRLAREPVTVLTAARDTVDLRDQAAVTAWFAEARPDAVFLAAAKVGGILANDRSPADFLYDNLMIEANLIHAAHQTGVAKLLFLGSSCIYPKHATQPMDEAQLLTGPLEPTNEWYAIAKIAGIKLCQAYARQHGRRFISAMPTNLYGPGDTYDLQTSHVIPALIRKMHEARSAGAQTVTLWGSGRPRREFLYVDDLADALVFLMRHYEAPEHVNVGWGEDVTIAEVAERIAAAVGFTGRFDYDTTKPDGTPRKLLDTRRLNALGWRPGVTLDDGLARTYRAFLADHG
ncbi:GDP-L-fucose synthase [Rhodothalassium salexigens DSM 2132]|uniref:GDP-L-fucose synthase n=1 Tax=Rhodothalassium salexigens DSM 2132 TaxID=1188247 RepID=A0A4R2PEP0_RHOSA|nr:GDP-L-fucose synthase [Rhodothalassium salexigens]MBB4212079.1 GDP-L-fucose synthase [Rhodothalassium salexigens DSM 2132]MBK1638296.1 GDP-fucose synthetase [Rhodothalassium salexigens DSM 2132]TCP32954.1 GDP-L-fucose synthase [Rhodothalassium salexigens DSM 2132]